MILIHKMGRSSSSITIHAIQAILIIAILVTLYLIYAHRGPVFISMKEGFAPVEPEIQADSHEKQFIISPDNVPTYALYQPNISGRHLNFLSHAPNTVPFYPDQLWTAQISDPYYQPAYKSYFYQEGYFYPLR